MTDWLTLASSVTSTGADQEHVKQQRDEDCRSICYCHKQPTIQQPSFDHFVETPIGDCLTDWLTEWLIHWLTDWPTDRLLSLQEQQTVSNSPRTARTPNDSLWSEISLTASESHDSTARSRAPTVTFASDTRDPPPRPHHRNHWRSAKRDRLPKIHWPQTDSTDLALDMLCLYILLETFTHTWINIFWYGGFIVARPWHLNMTHDLLDLHEMHDIWIGL